ncbi:STAS domain-containing protein [Nocardia sp. NPDC046763]|uniref:STAS domain-containing protein n=1 Tax=Nocardia sp. NPDC046763 TaxID=3155256 RepID=UPI0033E2F45A
MNHRIDPLHVVSASATTTLGYTRVCTVGGEIDILTAPAFRKALLGSLKFGESTLVDMSAVTFFGVAGIRALIAARELADRRHCAMCIEGSYCVTRVLEVVGLATEFDIRKSTPPG